MSAVYVEEGKAVSLLVSEADDPPAYALRGSAEAATVEFDEFYQRTSAGLLRQMHAFTGSHDEAQDCVHDAYIRAWQRWDTAASHGDPVAWVRTVAVRLAMNRFRKTRNMLKAYVRHGAPESSPDLSPDAVALLRALKQIPEPQRRTVVLHHFVDMTVAEIAEVMSVPSGTVKARLSRGRDALARLLGPLDPAADALPSRTATEKTHV